MRHLKIYKQKMVIEDYPDEYEDYQLHNTAEKYNI